MSRSPSAYSRRLGQVARVALGAPGGNPGGDRSLLVGAEPGLVRERAVLGAGVPRRHAAGLHDLVDHLGPAGGLARRSSARTGRSPLRGGRRRIDRGGFRARVGIGDVPALVGLAITADPATRGSVFGVVPGGRASIRRSRLGEVATGRRRPVDPEGVLVVDPASIRATRAASRTTTSGSGRRRAGPRVFADVLQERERGPVAPWRTVPVTRGHPAGWR